MSTYHVFLQFHVKKWNNKFFWWKLNVLKFFVLLKFFSLTKYIKYFSKDVCGVVTLIFLNNKKTMSSIIIKSKIKRNCPKKIFAKIEQQNFFLQILKRNKWKYKSNKVFKYNKFHISIWVGPFLDDFTNFYPWDGITIFIFEISSIHIYNKK